MIGTLSGVSCPSGGTGRRAGFKIPFLRECRFDSGGGHHKCCAIACPSTFIFLVSKRGFIFRCSSLQVFTFGKLPDGRVNAVVSKRPVFQQCVLPPLLVQ